MDGIKKEEELHNFEDFDSILKLKNSEFERVRDLASEILDRLSLEQLSLKFSNLIEATNSESFLIRSEAFRLLKKIPVENFPWSFSLDDVYNLTDEKVVEYLTLTIASSWNHSRKISNFGFIVKMVQSKNEKIARLGSSIKIDIIEFLRPSTLLLVYFDFLVDCAKKYDLQIAEKAVNLAIKALRVASLEKRLESLCFMVENSEIIDLSDIVLKTISENPEKRTYPEFTRFFLKTLEKNNELEKQIALNCLYSIEPDSLPLDVLIYSQMSSSMVVRNHSKKLLKRLSERKLLENLDFLLSCLSENYYIRFVATSLIEKISPESLLKEKAILEKYKKRNMFANDLFQSLAL